jgi:hypothetical protein
MAPNRGKCPKEAIGKRVIVNLANGRVCGREAVSSATPVGWAADGKSGCRWSISGSEWDIANYQVLG